MEKGKAMPSGAMLRKLADALSTDIDELSSLTDQIDPEISQLIKDKHKAIPSFLRSAKDRTPEQWAALQKQNPYSSNRHPNANLAECHR